MQAKLSIDTTTGKRMLHAEGPKVSRPDAELEAEDIRINGFDILRLKGGDPDRGIAVPAGELIWMARPGTTLCDKVCAIESWSCAEKRNGQWTVVA